MKTAAGKSQAVLNASSTVSKVSDGHGHNGEPFTGQRALNRAPVRGLIEASDKDEPFEAYLNMLQSGMDPSANADNDPNANTSPIPLLMGGGLSLPLSRGKHAEQSSQRS